MTKYNGGAVEIFDFKSKKAGDRIADMLADTMMHKGLVPFAQDIIGRAKAFAPNRYYGQKRREPAYIESFGYETKVGVLPDRGHKRAYVEVFNDAHHALYVEWGNYAVQKHAPLRKAAGVTNFSADKGVIKQKRRSIFF